MRVIILLSENSKTLNKDGNYSNIKLKISIISEIGMVTVIKKVQEYFTKQMIIFILEILIQHRTEKEFMNQLSTSISMKEISHLEGFREKENFIAQKIYLVMKDLLTANQSQLLVTSLSTTLKTKLNPTQSFLITILKILQES